MLTKDEIMRKMAGFDCPSYLYESNWKPIYDQCVAAIDLVAENERLKDDIKQLIAGNEVIHSIIDGTIKMSGDMISMIRIGLVDMFRSSGATNFLIQNLKDPKTGEEFTMNIQKTNALLPEQKYIIAQAENERLKADLSALTDVRRVADNLVEMERINRMGDLAAENKLLRAKLDAVRELAMEETYGTANMSWSKAMKNILGILDRDGDGE